MLIFSKALSVPCVLPIQPLYFINNYVHRTTTNFLITKIFPFYCKAITKFKRHNLTFQRTGYMYVCTYIYVYTHTHTHTHIYIYTYACTYMYIHRVIHKSLRDFRPLRYSSRDGHAEGKHVNRGRDTPSFCPTLQMLDKSTLVDAADVDPVIKFLPHTCNARVWQELDYRIDICLVTKGGLIEHL